MYELPHQLWNDLTLMSLGNQEISGEYVTTYNDSMVPSIPVKMKILSILARNS